MAKTLMIRPQVAALCACRPHFFSNLALPCAQAAKSYRQSLAPCVLLLQKFGPRRRSVNYGPKPEGLAVDRRSLCILATTQANDPGSIDSPLMQSMEKKIKEQLNADLVTVKDAYGDGRHVSIDVIASSFEGQSAVNRQRMVYKAIWEELQNTVHAVDQMTTKTPSEAESKK